MLKANNTFRFVFMLLSIVFAENVYCGVIPNSTVLQSVVKNQSLDEISNYLHETDNWPKIISVQAREYVSAEENKLHEEASALAEELLEKIIKFEGRHRNVDLDSLHQILATYGKLGESLRNKHGYTNLVLTETVYRLALSHLGFFLMQNPDKHELVHSLWRNLSRPFYDIAVIEEIGRGEFGMADAEVQAEMYVESLWRFFPQFSKAERETFADPLEMFKTHHLMKSLHGIETLVNRMAMTDLILEVSIPGMVEFLRKGGEIAELSSYKRDDRPFLELMDGFDYQKLKSNFSGTARLHSSNLVLLTYQFGSSLKQSPFYITLFLNQ